MGYKEKDKTRLDEAKERARAILEKLPDSSLVFVVDSAEPRRAAGLSPAAARKRIDELTIHPVNRPLNAAMGQVYPAVAECDRPRHEVYVLTDLARSSWNPEQPAEGLDQVEKVKASPGGKIATFVLRLGSQERADVAIDAAEPASSVATQGEPVEIQGLVRAQGTKPASRVVEFYLDGVKKDEKPVELAPGGQVEVSFTDPSRAQGRGGPPGRAQAQRRARPARVQRQPLLHLQGPAGAKVLLISDQAIDADFVAAALDPDPPPGRPRRSRSSRVQPAEFVGQATATRSKDHAAVFLLNVEAARRRRLGPAQRLRPRGRRPGGRPGRPLPAPRTTTGRPPASSCRPSSRSRSTAKAETHLRQDRRRHPSAVPAVCQGARAAARRCPGLPLLGRQAAARGARALLSFSDEAPALLERTFKGAKTGRVLLWTTPLARRVQPDRPRRVERVPARRGILGVPGADEPDGPLPGRARRTSSSTSRPARMCC